MARRRAIRKIGPAPREFNASQNVQTRQRSTRTVTDTRENSERRRVDHFVFQMEENGEERQQDLDGAQNAENNRRGTVPGENDNTVIFSFPFSYMTTHFSFMQLMRLLYVGKKDRIRSWKSVLHLIAFGLCYLLALVWEVGRGKHFMLTYQKQTSAFYIITAWFYFHTFFISVYFLKLVIQNAVTEFLANMDNTMEDQIQDKKRFTKKMSKVSVGLAILNLLISGYMSSGVNLVLNSNFDHEDVLMIRGFQFKGRFLYWEKEDYINRIEQLVNVTSPETEDIIYGTAEIGLEFFGWLHYTSMKDTVLVSALTLYSFTNEFKDFMYETRNERMSLSLLGKLEDNWDVLHQVSNDIESQFGALFNMIAIDNWLSGAYCILRFMQNDFKFDGYFLLNVIMFGKSLLAYILAALARKTGGMLKRRLNTKAPRAGSADDMVLKGNIVYFEQKISNTPVGMGTGNFVVDETFVYKYIGSVMSTGVAFLDHQKKDRES